MVKLVADYGIKPESLHATANAYHTDQVCINFSQITRCRHSLMINIQEPQLSQCCQREEALDRSAFNHFCAQLSQLCEL
jgi:hypothetical protein